MKGHNRMSQKAASKRDKLIYEAINDRYELEWKRTNDLDSKASNVTGFAGLLATLTAGITRFLPDSHYEWLFLIPLTLFILSALSGLLAYWITSFNAIDPDALIEGYKDRPEIDVLIAITATTSEHTIHNYLLNQRKVRWIYSSFVLLVSAVVLFFVVSIINWML
jgi:hypothetical protein